MDTFNSKQVVLTVASSLLLIAAQGQTDTFHPFPDNMISRVDVTVNNNQGFNCTDIYSFHYYFSGDTLINALPHRKVYRSYGALTVSPGQPCNLVPMLQYPGYMGALRDDPVANKTFFAFPDQGDTLLYDYNLNEGDPVDGILATDCSTMVTSVDSILIDGNYRLRWNISTCWASNQYFIQGIGSSFGLIERFNNPLGRLICVKDSTETLFSSGVASDFGCQLIQEGISEVGQRNKVDVRPNPFTTQTTVQLERPLINGTLTFYNSMGQVKQRSGGLFGKVITIRREDLPAGVYHIQLAQDGKLIWAGSVVAMDK